jgi:CheY-like chemotaxis protein
MRILLIDDSPDVARMLTMLMGREGHDITWAATGQAALNFVAVEPFDVIISDIFLPDIDGFSLMEKIRVRCDTPAIAHTGDFEIDNRIAARAAGFVGHVLKPDSFAQLLSMVRRVRSTRLQAVA